MKIVLTPLAATLRGPDDPAYKGKVPERARYMAPDAAAALGTLTVATGNKLVWTDILRSPAASLQARRYKRGVQRPGYSGHNFGFSGDLDVVASLRALECDYAKLVDIMREHGFECYRRDLDPSASESWHFNHFGADAARYLSEVKAGDSRTWGAALELKIQERYGTELILDPLAVQIALQGHKLYYGKLDGILGPKSRAAIASFQQLWGLPTSGDADKRTQRTLTTVMATHVLQP